MAASDQNGMADSCCKSSLDIALLVADHPGFGKVDVVLFGCPKQHARIWFSAAAAGVWCMRAVVDSINQHTVFAELSEHPERQCLKIIFCVVAPADTGLIGDNDEPVAKRLKVSACFKNAVDEFKCFYSVEVLLLYINDTVPVQKNCPHRSAFFSESIAKIIPVRFKC